MNRKLSKRCLFNLIPDGSLHIIRYEDLKDNTLEELAEVLRFLDIPFTKNARQCVKNNIEGYYHRKATKDTLYPLLNTGTRQYLSQIYEQVMDIVQKKRRDEEKGY